MTRNELNIMLEAHKKWINGEKGGKKAKLQGANLRGADLHGADIRGTKLQGTDLRDANFQGADLHGADIDYACWPLWCGSFDVRVDRRIFCQLAYHLCRVIVDDDSCKEAQLMLGRLANEFHRAAECGRVPETPRWINVEDRLPDDDDSYLVWNGNHIFVAIYWGGGEWMFDSYATHEVTHWMPLPEPPKED